MADALHRDLFTDGRTLEDLDWRELWAYIVKAPPNTAIHYQRSEGWTRADEIALEQLNEQREMLWRYVAVNFQGGKDVKRPERISRQTIAESAEAEAPQPKTLDELVPAHVRALMQGG